MKCPRCDHVRTGQGTFCTRCGVAFKPACPGTIGAETVLLIVRSSWWRFLADILFAIDFVLAGLYLFVYGLSAIVGVLLAKAEIKLIDTRSIKVVRSQPQKLLFNTGSVVVASLSNATRQMRIDNIAHPDGIAQTIKEARRKRFK